MKKTIIWILFLLLLIWGLTSLFNQEDSSLGLNEPIKVGVLAPLSGPFAQFGEEIREALLDSQADGIELVIEDTACDVKPTLSSYRKLIDIDKVNFIIGPFCGAPQEIVAPLVAEDEIITIVPAAATRDLYEMSGGNMFQIQYSLQDDAQNIADKMYELGHNKVVLISFQNAFSEIYKNTFKESFRGEIVAELDFLNETTDVASELIKIKNIDADAIFSTDASFYFAQGKARLSQYEIDLPFFSQYASDLPDIRPLVPEGAIYSFPANLGDKGSFYELTRIGAEFANDSILKCAGDPGCVKDSLDNSGDFDEYGVRKQDIIFKQVIDGEPVLFEE